MEAFDTLFDRMVLHQVRLMQLAILYQAQAQLSIDETEEQVSDIAAGVAAYLVSVGGLRSDDPRARTKIERAVQEIRSLRNTGYKKSFETVNNAMKGLVSYETQFMTAALKPHANLNVSRFTNLASVEVMGHTMTNWRERLISNDMRRLTEGLKLGARLGDKEADIRARLVGNSSYRGANGATAVARNELDTLVRTATNAFADAARVQINFENALLGKEIYVAILDSRTTDQCQSLHKQVFGANEGPRPPIHWYCRSTRVSLLGTTNPTIPTYSEWLNRIKASERAEVLGGRQASAFGRGELTIDRFREPNWQGIDLKTLARRESRVFEDAGMEVPLQ